MSLASPQEEPSVRNVIGTDSSKAEGWEAWGVTGSSGVRPQCCHAVGKYQYLGRIIESDFMILIFQGINIPDLYEISHAVVC